MPVTAPTAIFAAVHGMAETLRLNGYKAKRNGQHAILVEARFLVEPKSHADVPVFHLNAQHPRSPHVDPSIRVRVVGMVPSMNIIVRATCNLDEWFPTFQGIWDRVVAARDTVVAARQQRAQEHGMTVDVAKQAISQLNLPQPAVLRVNDKQVDIVYPHASAKCKPEDAGTVAFALWNLPRS